VPPLLLRAMVDTQQVIYGELIGNQQATHHKVISEVV